MSERKLDRIIELLEMQVGVRPITPAPAELLDYADEPTSATQDAPSGRIGWWRSPLLNGRHLVREVEGGWSCDDIDFPNFQADNHPDAVFTPIATLPKGHVAVDRGELHYAVSIAEDNTKHLYSRPELRHLRAALKRSQP